MGDSRRKCERSAGEAAAMEVGDIGGCQIIKMRATEVELTSSSKRRKVEDSDAAELQLNLPANSLSATSDFEEEKMKSTDLKQKYSETEISTFNIGQFSRETTPSSEAYEGYSSVESMESPSPKSKKSSPKNLQFKISVKEKPSAEEIENFLDMAKNEQEQSQKEFMEKYNFDVVNDVPLEGRYAWLRLK